MTVGDVTNPMIRMRKQGMRILITGIVSIVIQFGLAIVGWAGERVLCGSSAPGARWVTMVHLTRTFSKYACGGNPTSF